MMVEGGKNNSCLSIVLTIALTTQFPFFLSYLNDKRSISKLISCFDVFITFNRTFRSSIKKSLNTQLFFSRNHFVKCSLFYRQIACIWLRFNYFVQFGASVLSYSSLLNFVMV